jgi:hypothetical protein
MSHHEAITLNLLDVLKNVIQYEREYGNARPVEEVANEVIEDASLQLFGPPPKPKE